MVQIKQGTLRGSADSSRGGREFLSFQGIPYAAPPVNQLRFKEAQPHPGWEGERDATYLRDVCPQASFSSPKTYWGNEDCLFLNIYTPQLDSSAKLPVIVFIHGGAFKVGSSNILKPKFIMDETIVFVTINYRLGVLGFMTFGDEAIPANLGLRDQVSALKWVRENIINFGGDPNSVTVAGNSAGAASVDFLIVSPLSQGLFQNAILVSGAANCPWSITPRDIAKQKAEAVATLLGCPSSPHSEAVNCLRDNISAELLVMNGEKFEEWFLAPLATFNAVLDGSFLPSHPLHLKPHKINAIIGINAYEGTMLAVQVCENNFKLARELEADPTRKLPFYTMLLDQMANEDKKKVSQDIMDFYMKGEKINEKTVGTNFEELIKDFLFAHGSYKSTLHYYKEIPVYFYVNDVPLPKGLSYGFFEDCPYTKGPSHGEESFFFFNDILDGFINHTTVMTEVDNQISRRFINLWTTFARTGVPSEKWSPVRSNKIEYLYITTDDMVMKSDLYTSRMQFIDTLPIYVNQNELREKSELR